jgi:hypothetical protein
MPPTSGPSAPSSRGTLVPEARFPGTHPRGGPDGGHDDVRHGREHRCDAERDTSNEAHGAIVDGGAAQYW